MNFIFKEEDIGKSIKVYLGKESQENYVCNVRKYSSYKGNKGYYGIDNYSMSSSRGADDYFRQLSGVPLKFNTKEEAANFAYNFNKTVKETIDTKPLSQDVMSYLKTRARDLAREKQELMSNFVRIDNELYLLEQLGKKYNVEGLLCAIESNLNSDCVEKLLDFKVYVDNEGVVPFFSEVSLYSLIGKENARTVLALLSNVISKIDPSKANHL